MLIKCFPDNYFLVKLDGGLGNQLFQLAFAISKSKKTGKDFYFDVTSFESHSRKVTPRKFALEVFGLTPHIDWPKTTWQSVLYKLKLFSIWISLSRGNYNEKSVEFDKEALFNEDKFYFKGYWQSYKYFSDVSDLIKNRLSPQKSLSDSFIELKERIVPENAVMIHVRRGDYVSSKSANDFHGLLNSEYYKKAIQLIVEIRPQSQFVIFSDEIEFCKKSEIFKDLNAIFIDNDPSREEWEDLLLMSYCSNQIIANSSFSWWSAWISDMNYSHVNRTVIAPKAWFTNKTISTADRFPEHWILLD